MFPVTLWPVSFPVATMTDAPPRTADAIASFSGTAAQLVDVPPLLACPDWLLARGAEAAPFCCGPALPAALPAAGALAAGTAAEEDIPATGVPPESPCTTAPVITAVPRVTALPPLAAS